MIEAHTIWWVFWLAVTFWLAKSIIPVLILMADRYNLYDDPNNSRKVHTSAVPTLGGVAIFLSFLIAFSFMVGFGSLGDATIGEGFGFFVAASLILFGVGIKDDMLTLSPKKKLMAQIAASLFVILGLGLQIQSFGGVFGLDAVPGWIGIPLTLFTMIVVINAYNLIDGIDGLAGGVGVIISLFFGYWFFLAGLHQWAVFSTLLAASLAGFLWYNASPAAIFMGDTGSLIVGFFIAMQAVAFVQYGLVLDAVTGWQHAVPVIAMAVLVVPLYDTLRIFSIRVSRGQSPFQPDRSHLHHFLLDTGCNHREATTILCLVNVFFIGLSVLLAGVIGNTLLFFTLFGVALLVLPTNGWKSRLLRPVLAGISGEDKGQDERVDYKPSHIPPELVEPYQPEPLASERKEREVELV